MIKKIINFAFVGFIIFNPNSNTTAIFKEKYGIPGIYEYNHINKCEIKNNQYFVYENDSLKAVLDMSNYSIIHIQ
jgi:hypothetical protein